MTREDYFKHMRKSRDQRAEARLRHQMGFLYRDVDFVGKRVLDIGGGAGLHSLYAVVCGATEALIIEPEGDGGHDEMIAEFNVWRDALKAQQATLQKNTLQDFALSSERGYDIVLIQDAINHFDEPACVALRSSADCMRRYEAIFHKISSLVMPGGQLMLSDCSSRNLFPSIGMRNPFDPEIEWDKHQPPSVWSGLAERHGLEITDLRWSSPTRLGGIGQGLMGNALASWFFTSHFVATYRKRQK